MKRWLFAALLTLSCDAAPEHHDEHDEHDEHGEGLSDRVELDPHVVERNGIATEPAARRLLLGSLEVPAEVQVNPDQMAHVSPLIPGRISDTRAALGQTVKRGEVLAEVRSVELGRSRGALAAARARKKAADAALARVETLVGEGISAKKVRIEAQSKVDQADAEVAAIRSALSVYGSSKGGGATLALTSPIDGIVVQRHASPGEFVDPTSDPFLVANLDTVWVMGRVYEQEIAQVSVGTPAEVSFIAYPGRVWTGSIDYVSPTLDEHTRTVTVRMVLDNPGGELRPGMFGTLALQGETSRSADADGTVLAVPSAALMTLGERRVVFVRGDEEGVFVARDVVPGAAAHGFVEIREGLKAGEPVVTRGAFVLKSVVLGSSIGGGHAH